MKFFPFFFLGTLCLGIVIGLTLPDILQRFKKPIILKKIPREEAKQKILQYITENEGKLTSDIIFDLELEVDLVLNVLEELVKEELIGPHSSASSRKSEESKP